MATIKKNIAICVLLGSALAASATIHFCLPLECSIPKAQTAYPLQGKSYPPTQLSFTADPYIQTDSKSLPIISNVQVFKIDNDSTNGLLVCDAQKHQVIHYTFNTANNIWENRVLSHNLRAPAHATPCDIDNDGDTDIIIADLGDIFPNDGYCGSIVLLENKNGIFHSRIIKDNLRRVADVQCGDFNNDGRLDLIAAVFGHDHGEILYLSQGENLSFSSQQLLQGPGAIHVPVADFDNDGDLDFATVLSQNEEEIWIFENDGTGSFTKHLIFNTLNYDLGSAGLVCFDIDQDGDSDLLLPAGDNLERSFQFPQTYHGCYLFENTGGLQFTQTKISTLPGCYAAACGDIDNDGDIDISLVSMVNDWSKPSSASVTLLINDGQQNFTEEQLASRPRCFITNAIGDINNDGYNDIICGSFRAMPPFEYAPAIQVWLGHEK